VHHVTGASHPSCLCIGLLVFEIFQHKEALNMINSESTEGNSHCTGIQYTQVCAINAGSSLHNYGTVGSNC